MLWAATGELKCLDSHQYTNTENAVEPFYARVAPKDAAQKANEFENKFGKPVRQLQVKYK
jgi:hypothetical protein